MAKCVINPKHFQYFIYIKKCEFYHIYVNMVERFKYYKLRIKNLAEFKWKTLIYAYINIEK